MAPCGKELSEDLKKRIVALHKDGLGYKKIANTLKLSCSTVAKTSDDHCLAKETEGKGAGLTKHVSRPKLLLSICGASSNGRWRSTSSLTSTSSVMSSWRSGRGLPVATCEALVNSMPKRVKTVLENNGGHTKY
ncbi:hypothetical protein L3Q82_013547 [Scortum barcoo]|uniref:Uncharacterized protein n=1 Tax=Scortum barcoo TaxID=214431 RepID=A0ACB8W1L8_9TELE|nr:hypothetical protein L3Q82_013547 [Scortum barcoo]